MEGISHELVSTFIFYCSLVLLKTLLMAFWTAKRRFATGVIHVKNRQLNIIFYQFITFKFYIGPRECQISMQGPQLCAKPRHFCKLDMATSRIAFLDLNLHVVQVATSNSNN